MEPITKLVLANGYRIQTAKKNNSARIQNKFIG